MWVGGREEGEMGYEGGRGRELGGGVGGEERKGRERKKKKKKDKNIGDSRKFMRFLI